MTDERVRTAESIDPDTAEAAVREVLTVAGLAFLTLLGTAVPRAGRELPGTAVAVSELVLAAGGAAIAGSLLYALPTARALVCETLAGPDGVVADLAWAADYLVAFLAVLVAHAGTGPATMALLGDPWLYDLAFLAVALVPLALLGRRLYSSRDAVAAMVSRDVAGIAGGSEA